MRAGWDARRRNRNIGTAARGRGQDNRLVIPCRGPRYEPFWACLTDFRAVTRAVWGKPLTVLVEPTRAGCVHPCTPDDVFALLAHVPARDREGLALVVLRQPKRKEQVLSPCWGRLAYHAEIGEHKGPAIILEAVDLARPRTRWDRSLGPEVSAELDRLRADGHLIRPDRRGYVLEMTLEGARSTQLYRTLPHEVGHWVDYLQRVKRPSRSKPSSAWGPLWDRYHQRPAAEKEGFAHRYADGLGARLRQGRVIPFGRLLDERRLLRDGLRLVDFVAG
jgi:hypothetical protein